MSNQLNEKINVIQGEHIEYIDILRVLSMLSVVFLHTAAGSLRGNIGSLTWHVSNVFTSIMSTSVPIFFMISGAMLMNSKKTLSIIFTYKKRIPKAFVPFLIWSLVAVAYYAALNLKVSGSIDVEAAIKRLKNIPSQPTTIHLWFMYALIPLYMLSPILKKLVDSLTQNLTKYLLLIWLVFSSVLPTAASFIPTKYQSLFVLNSAYNLNFMSGYLGYFLVGYYLLNFSGRISKKLLTYIIVIDTVVISLGSWYKTIEIGNYSELFKGYTRVFTLVLSVAIFLLIKELLIDRRLPRPAWSAVQFLSSVSFGVYLLHNLLVDLVSHKINILPAKSIYVLFFCYFIVLLVSLACIVILASCKLTCFAFTGMTYNNAGNTCNIQYFFKKYFANNEKKIRQKNSVIS